MPNRVLKDSIKRSPQIDSLTWFEEVVFYRLIITADDYGRYYGNPIVLRNDLFPTKESITKKSIEDALRKLEAQQLIIRYEVDGTPYVALTTWKKHQRVRDSIEKFPSPQVAATCGDLPQNPAVIQIQSKSKSESLSIQQLQQSAHEGAREDAPTKHEVTMYFVSIVRDVGQAMNEANKFYAYNALRNWECLPDWKATADLWCARIPDHLPQDVGEDTDDAAFFVALTKTE